MIRAQTLFTGSHAVKALIALAIASLMLLVLAVPAPAQELICQDPTLDQYGVPTGPAECVTVQSGDAGGGAGPELPFTGFDAITLLAIAAALTGAGIALRRFAVYRGEQS